MTRVGMPVVGFLLLVHMVDGVGIERQSADTQDDGVTSGCASSSSCARPEVAVVVYASDWCKVCPKLLVRTETWCRR